MAGNYIRLAEVLVKMDELDNKGHPIPFSIKFVTANRKTGTGGEVIEIDKCVKCVGKKGDGTPIIDTRKLGQPVAPTKDPHHWANSTRNLLLPNNQIRKIHIRLIIEFNGYKVCY